MNPQEFIAMQNKIASLEETINQLQQVINGIKIDSQRFMKSNGSIEPGIATKIAFDSNGIITGCDKLQESDIPNIHIDKIEGLRDILNEISDSEVNVISEDPEIDPNIVNTGTKVNYNKDGKIVSSSNLTADDIPSLPIEKIDGLNDLVNSIQVQMKSNSQVNIEGTRTINIPPGTYKSITIDENGNIVAGDMDSSDNNYELLTMINALENKLLEYTPMKLYNALADQVSKKVDENQSAASGTFTKVHVDDKGFVIHGEELTLKDLPNIGIKDITDLDTTLRKKAEIGDLIELNEIVSGLVSSMNRVGDVVGIKNHLDMKADESELRSISSQVSGLQKLMNELSNKIPNELIMEEFQQIKLELSNLSGRISVLENKMIS